MCTPDCSNKRDLRHTSPNLRKLQRRVSVKPGPPIFLFRESACAPHSGTCVSSLGMSSLRFSEKLCAARVSGLAHLPHRADPEPSVSLLQPLFAYEPLQVNLPLFPAAFYNAVLP